MLYYRFNHDGDGYANENEPHRFCFKVSDWVAVYKTQKLGKGLLRKGENRKIRLYVIIMRNFISI